MKQVIGAVLFAAGHALGDTGDDSIKPIGMLLIIVGFLLIGDSRWGKK